jgi:hypothetical protein
MRHRDPAFAPPEPQAVAAAPASPVPAALPAKRDRADTPDCHDGQRGDAHSMGPDTYRRYCLLSAEARAMLAQVCVPIRALRLHLCVSSGE